MIKEYTRPLEQGIDSDKNIFSVLEERVERTPDDNLVEYKNAQGEWVAFTAAEFKNKVVALAKGLIARGVMPGDSVSIIAHTCWQWTALDVAIMSIGALTVPVYETNSPAQVKMIFNDANVKMAFAEDDFQRDKIESVRDQCPDLGDVYVIGLGAIDTIIEYGRAVSDAEFLEREQAVKGSDLATIVYTSGSTGTPKGVELTHANFVFITYSGVNSMPDIAMKPNRRLLLFLPLAHVFARYMQFFCFAGNVSLGLSSNLKTILADFKAFKPTFILAVPRIFEKIYNAASQKAGAGFKGRVFADATQTAYDWSHAQQSGGSIPLALNAKHALYNKLVYSSIMEVFGGHVEYAVSGGAPLDSSIAHFFNGVGLPLLEGYGMTETSPIISVNKIGANHPDTVGPILQGIEAKLGEKDELLVRGPQVMRGYWKRPEDTFKTLDPEGWLSTGDQADILPGNYLKIKGRIKEIIVTSTGEKVPPVDIEQAIETDPLFDQAMVYGDNRPFIVGLLVLNKDNFERFAGSLNLDSKDPEILTNKAVIREILKRIKSACKSFPQYGVPRSVLLLKDPWTIENDSLTPTLKLKRRVILAKHGNEIEKLYEDFGK